MRKVAEKGLFLWLTFFVLLLLAESGQAVIESEAIVAIWLFDGGATDSSDNANDGETRGAVEFVDDGKFGEVLYFPKQGERIEMLLPPSQFLRGNHLHHNMRI